MELLYILEDLRNPILDAVFSFITNFGDEIAFIGAGVLFFWCINKREGYFILSVGLIGTVINQCLKVLFQIPRPWVKDPAFTPVGDAIESASGYSFPSGHTQNSVGVFGSIARWEKNTVARIICIALCVLVPFSRMYLGVHTPLDVGVSVIIAVILIFGMYPLFRKSAENPKLMRLLLAVMTAIVIGVVIFMNVYPFNTPTEQDAINVAHGAESAATMLGCILGLWVTFEVDERFIRFDTKAVWWAQIIKLIVGLGLLIAVKEGLRTPLEMLLVNENLARGARYFMVVIFAGCIWPLTFRFFSKLGRK